MRITRSMRTLINFRRWNCAPLNHEMPEASGSSAQIKVCLNHLSLMMYNAFFLPRNIYLIVSINTYPSFVHSLECMCFHQKRLIKPSHNGFPEVTNIHSLYHVIASTVAADVHLKTNINANEIWRKPNGRVLQRAKIFQRAEGGIISKDDSAPGENVINNERVTGASSRSSTWRCNRP